MQPYHPISWVKCVRLGVLVAAVLTGCSPRLAGTTGAAPASSPTAALGTVVPNQSRGLTVEFTPTPAASPEPYLSPTFSITPDLPPTSTPTATAVPLDAETEAFVVEHGREWNDYIQFDAELNVYRVRMAFAEFSTEVQPVSNQEGALMGNATLSVMLEYFDGSKKQSILVPILIRQGTECSQRGMGTFPCSMFSVDTLLAAYRDDGRSGPGWDAKGIGVEIWLMGDEDPAPPGSWDGMAAAYKEANAGAYEMFLDEGDPSIEMVVPVNVLTACSPDWEFVAVGDPYYDCYPKPEPTAKLPERTPAS